MEISIYEQKGKPIIQIVGNGKNTPVQIAKAYKLVKEELAKD